MKAKKKFNNKLFSMILTLVMVCALFPKTTFAAPAEIESVAITGVTAPVTGETPTTTGITTADASYSIAFAYWQPEDKTFSGGTAYTIIIKLEAAGTEKFTANTKFLVNGNAATLVSPNPITDSVEEVTLSYTFPKTEGTHTCVGTFVPQLEPTFTTVGMVEHYECSCGKLFEDAECTTEIIDLEPYILPMLDYEIIKGMNGIYVKGSGKTLEFTANGPFEDCTGIMVSGSFVDESNYTLASGSTIVTLSNAYLETLTEGDYSINVLYGNRGEASTEFSVKPASTLPVPATCTLTTSVNGGHGSIEPAGSNVFDLNKEITIIFKPDKGYEIDKVTVNGVETGVLSNVLNVKMDNDKNVVVTYKQTPNGTTAAKTTPTKPKQATSLKTGDSNNTLLWISLLVVSCGGILTTGIIRKKRGHSK